MTLLWLVSSLSITVPSDGSGFFALPDSVWAAPEGAFAIADGDTLPAFNASRGAEAGLRVVPPPAAGTAVTLFFDALPLSHPNSVELRLEPLARIPLGTMSPRAFGPSGEGLYISGVKRLGVSLGSEGGLVQGTRISLDGIIAPGVAVRGSITDESLPLGSASSEALAELDRVNLLVEGNAWSAELGDMEREEAGEGLSPVRYRRSVSGFYGTASPSGPAGIGAGYGVTGARRYNTVFLTQEGVQGPYRFAPSGVTPGSERVYLDGQLLQRGSGADYTVDYPGGSITFTPSRLIRMDQRVEVSCYREGDGFRRGILAGDLSWGDEGFSIGSRLFREGDDTRAPLGFVMSPEAREALENAGENPEDAWIDGGVYLGEGKGAYTLDSLDRFVYRGPGGGDWAVDFQRPPQGDGDYIYDSVLGGFRWVGEGEGTHLPRKYIDIPSMMEAGGLDVRGAAGSFTGELSGYVSRREGNLFNRSETTREGTFLSSRLVFSPWDDGPALFARGRMVSDGFTFPDESDPDSQLSRWLLPAGYKGNDSYAEAGLESPDLGLSGGRRFTEGGGSVDRTEAAAGFRPGRFDLRLTGSAGRRRGVPGLADGNRLGAGTSLEYAAGDFTPFLELNSNRESWADSLEGFVHHGQAGTRAVLGLWNLRLFSGGTLDGRGGAGLPDRVFRAGLTGSGRGPSWNMTGSVNHSTSWFPGGGQSRADAIMLGYFKSGPGWWTNTDYSAGGYLGRSVEIIYTWVGPGNGDYSYDPATGEYYPDPGGEYTRSFQPGQGVERVLECRLKSSGSLRLEGAGIDGSVTLATEDPAERLKTFLLAGAFDTSGPGQWSLTVAPWLSWEEDLVRRLTLRLFASDTRETLSGSGLRRTLERSVRLTPLLRPHQVVEVELSGRLTLKEQDLYGARRITGTLVSADPRYIPSPGVTAGVELSADTRRESNLSLKETSYGIRPHVSLNTRGWNASAGYSVAWIPGEGTLPPWFFDGVDRGVTLDGSLNAGRNLGRWFRLSLFFRARRPAGGEWTRTGGLEGTVSF